MVVDRFFTWVAEATSEQKSGAIEALVGACLDARVGEMEREALEAALMLVAEDPDPAVRRHLAEVLAERDDAPRHLLLALLEDRPDVAAPVVARSEALIDAELAEVVARGDDELRRATAGRRRVGPTVAVALAEAGDRAACVALLANPGADIPPIALERVVERFGEYSDLRKVLLARPHVPITIRHRVLEKLAEAIENLVVVKSWMGPERATQATLESREKATIALAGNATAAETVTLVEHLRRTGRLTTRLMLRAACVGDLRFVEEALALLADVPTQRVSALVADGRESAVRALYRRASMPERAWPAFRTAIEVHRELLAETGGFDGRPGDRARFSRRLVERVLTRFTAFERADADDLLVLLRRYAADAAREHVRHVMEERMADVARALAAPAPAPVVEDLAAVDPERAVDVDAAIFAALADELGVTEADVPLPYPVEEAAPAPAVITPVVDFAALCETPVDLDEVATEGGLFGHLRLEDLPPEWTSGEVAPEDLWGDEEISVRRTLEPEPRRFDAAEETIDPVVVLLRPAAAIDVASAVESETVASADDGRDDYDAPARADVDVEIEDAAEIEAVAEFPIETDATAAPIRETVAPSPRDVVVAELVDEIAAASLFTVEPVAEEPAAAESAATAPVVADAVAEAPVVAEDPQADDAPAPTPAASIEADPFIAELEAALDAILGPAPKPQTRRAA